MKTSIQLTNEINDITITKKDHSISYFYDVTHISINEYNGRKRLFIYNKFHMGDLEDFNNVLEIRELTKSKNLIDQLTQ